MKASAIHPAARAAFFASVGLVAILGGPAHLAALSALLAALLLPGLAPGGPSIPPLLPRAATAFLALLGLSLTVAINAFLVPGRPSPLLPGASVEGLRFGLLLAWRLALLLALVAAQVRWLPARDLLGAASAVPAVGLPVALAARFVPDIGREARRLSAIQRTRDVAREGRRVSRLSLAVPLVVSTMRRADRVAVALTLAGADLRPRTRLPRHGWGWREAAWLLAALLVLATLLPLNLA